MSGDENGNASERGTPKASSAVKEHARKMLAKLRAKLSGTHARYPHYGYRALWATVGVAFGPLFHLT
jgi:hypothetical protein